MRSTTGFAPATFERRRAYLGCTVSSVICVCCKVGLIFEKTSFLVHGIHKYAHSTQSMGMD